MDFWNRGLRRWWPSGLLASVWLASPTLALAAGEPGASAEGASSGWQMLLIYSVLVVCSSWLGGLLPSLVRLTHTRLQLLISLIGGLMLGVGLLHQLPHAVAVFDEGHVSHPLDRSMLWMLGGLTAMFFLLRMFHFHQHDSFEPEGGCGHGHSHHHHDHDHSHDHSHDHDSPDPLRIVTPAASDSAGRKHVHGTSWMGIALGLSLHTLIDGLALASHVKADLLHDPSSWLPGLGTFLGIVLHKPLDSLSITSLMTAGGWSARPRHLVNLLYATLCPLGALLFTFGLQAWTGSESLLVGAALAFSAGVFVCISLSDLLPEVEFHSHDRVSLSVALLAGLFIAWGIGFLEPEHSHGSGASAHHHSHSHDSHGHAPGSPGH